MSVNWKEVNTRRISEISQEIQLFCAKKKTEMTPRAFALARLSLGQLLDNITDRNPGYTKTPEAVRSSMNNHNNCIATCTDWQAATLARTVVYTCIGDDLNLYPITAEDKIQRAKIRNQPACDIPFDELTSNDIIYIVAASAKGENISSNTMISVFDWFKDIGMDPIQARVFSILYIAKKPIHIKSFPQQSLFSAEYNRAAKALVNQGFIYRIEDDKYCVTEILCL